MKERKNPSIHPPYPPIHTPCTAGWFPTFLSPPPATCLALSREPIFDCTFHSSFLDSICKPRANQKRRRVKVTQGQGQRVSITEDVKVKVSECLSLRMLSRSGHPSPTPFPRKSLTAGQFRNALLIRCGGGQTDLSIF